MFCLQTGDIIPGSRIGSIELGMSRKTLEVILTSYSIDELEYDDVYEARDVKIWVRKADDIVTQILVFGDFGGKLLDEFGVHSYLADIEKRLGISSKEEYYIYVFDDLKGICFELTDIDEDWDDVQWFKANAPIEAISVYSADD